MKSRLEAGKDYILGEKAAKTLRLSQAARMSLLDDFKAAKFPRNEMNRTWEKWLKSGEQHLAISFDSKYCKDNHRTTLISITHPLVKQAAIHLQSKGKVVATLKVKTDRFMAGEYPFAIFQWKLSGEREDLQMKPISANSALNMVILELLKESNDSNFKYELDYRNWDEVEEIHHEIWERELKEHKFKTGEMIRYKEASLKTSHMARMNTLKEQLKGSKDKNYQTMTDGKIRIAAEDFELHMDELQQAKTRADILFELLAYGMLIVEPVSERQLNTNLLDIMEHIANQYGKELIHTPVQLLSMLADFAPNMRTERKQLKQLYEVGIVQILNEDGIDDIDRAIKLAAKELDYDEELTKKLIKYLEAFYR